LPSSCGQAAPSLVQNTCASGGADVEVVPAVTVGAYTSGYVIGGIMTFADVRLANFTGALQSLVLKFKGTAQTVEFGVRKGCSAPATPTRSRSRRRGQREDNRFIRQYPFLIASKILDEASVRREPQLRGLLG